MSAPTDRHDGLAPILVSGLRWLYDTEQPRGALLRPGGVALPGGGAGSTRRISIGAEPAAPPAADPSVGGNPL